MKVCPDCKRTYDDDVEICEEDGTELLESEEIESQSQILRDVIAVGTSDATAIVDLEAMEDEIRTKLEQKEEEEALRKKEEEEEAARQAILNDPEATGMISLAEVKAKHAALARDAEISHSDVRQIESQTAARPGGPRSRMTEYEDESDPTAQVRNRGTGRHLEKEEKNKNKAALVFVALLFGMVFMGVLSLLFFRFVDPFGGRPVHLISKPKGATVVVDGETLGISPLDAKIKTGNHRLELRKKGYEPFKEIFSVQKGKTKVEVRFELQPLPGTLVGEEAENNSTLQEKLDEQENKRKSLTESIEENANEDATLSADEKADRLVEQTRIAISKRDYDAAFKHIQMLLKLAPEDARSDDLIDALATAREDTEEEIAAQKKERAKPKRKATTRNAEEAPLHLRLPRTRKERLALSRKAYTEGERLYRLGQFKDAKLMLSRAIQLAPRFAQPHRSLGRIYNREGNHRKVRYHLTRYLRLGGPDPDRKVRRWIEEHQKK